MVRKEHKRVREPVGAKNRGKTSSSLRNKERECVVDYSDDVYALISPVIILPK